MQAAITLWQKQMQKSLVHREEVIGMLIQPVLWIALFGVGMTRMLEPDGGGGNYISFMVPGIMALTTLGGAIAGGADWLNDRIRGIVKEYLVAPIPRLSILFGHALSIVTKALVQALIIMVVGVLMGARLGANPLGWLGGLLLIAGYGLGFAGIALLFASRINSPGGYHAIIFLLNLPLLFLSNALYTLEGLPGWMQVTARINPTSYLIDGLRQMMFTDAATLAGSQLIPLWQCFAVIAAFVVIGMGLAYRAFVRSIAL